ncbi:MAG: prephenate/arogenate dehydrogenase family protein [Alphaproteobacteria bacterium]|nr:prephenate/arogenate dehydrogenase family protein [Alphaproteobacteria bacterium]
MSIDTKRPHFERVALVGVGLIGSSLARVMRREGMVGSIIGCARTEATRTKALELGIVDEVTDDPAQAATGADLFILCTPLGTYGDIMAAAGPMLAAGAIVTDVGSAKVCTIRDVTPFLPEGVAFVPAHPVAGTEHSGPEAGFAELFQDRWCILTPTPETDAAAVDVVAALWKRAGSKVERMEAKHHDLVLAVTSHLPHLIAYNIVGTAADLEAVTESEVIKYSAGGFRDFTRIAASDPVMWRDIFLANREAVLEMLSRFNEDLARLQRAIRWGDGETLRDLFTRTRQIRRGIVDSGQDSNGPPKPPR